MSLYVFAGAWMVIAGSVDVLREGMEVHSERVTRSWTVGRSWCLDCE